MTMYIKCVFVNKVKWSIKQLGHALTYIKSVELLG